MPISYLIRRHNPILLHLTFTNLKFTPIKMHYGSNCVSCCYCCCCCCCCCCCRRRRRRRRRCCCCHCLRCPHIITIISSIIISLSYQRSNKLLLLLAVTAVYLPHPNVLFLQYFFLRLYAPICFHRSIDFHINPYVASSTKLTAYHLYTSLHPIMLHSYSLN